MSEPIDLFQNPRRRRDTTAPAPALLGEEASQIVLQQLQHCAAYRPTPLQRLTGLARELGVGDIYYKDESLRFGLKSFKSLGGTYASAMLLIQLLSDHLKRPATIQDLASGEHRAFTQTVMLVCATDGNHGKAVAAAARHFGCRATVFTPRSITEERFEAIQALGADVIRTGGTYDEAVDQATASAEKNGWHVVSDTSWPGYEEIPTNVMRGYTVIFAEILKVLDPDRRDEPPFTHIFVQAGVGGLAAAAAGYLTDRYRERAPTFIVVEPTAAACLLETARTGTLARLEGDLETSMAMLSCGEPSRVAWTILDRAADAFLAIPDAAAARAMQKLAAGTGGDPKIIAGESGAAGLAGLIELAGSTATRRAIGLNESSRILVIGSEGATDSTRYAEIVGNSANATAA